MDLARAISRCAGRPYGAASSSTVQIFVYSDSSSEESSHISAFHV